MCYVSVPFEIASKGLHRESSGVVITPNLPKPLKGLCIDAPDGVSHTGAIDLLRAAWVKVQAKKCTHPGCAAPPAAHSRCAAHPLGAVCSGPDCTRKAITKGMCQAHYLQARSGRAPGPIRTRSPLPTGVISVRLPFALLAQLGPTPSTEAARILTAHLTPQKGSL